MIFFITRILLACIVFYAPVSNGLDSLLHDLDGLVTEIKSDIEKSNSTIKNITSEIELLEKTPPVDPNKKSELEEKKKIEEDKTKAAQKRLDTLAKIRPELLYPDPVQQLINQYKTLRDQLPKDTEANQSQKEQRAIYDEKISKLEKITSSEQDSSVGYLISGIIIALIIALILTYFFHVKNPPSKGESQNSGDVEAFARIRLAKLMTQGALILIVFLSALTLLFAGLNASFAPPTPKDKELFFDIAKWILATVIPVIAAWVGGVMAYYFGKENFRAGAELAKTFTQTGQQKLENLKAGESGLKIEDAAVFRLDQTTKLLDANLKKLEESFTKNGKPYERLPIIDSKNCVQACLHKSKLKDYKDSLAEAERADTVFSTKKLNDLAVWDKWKPEDSFGTVTSSENLTRVQQIMSNNQECRDVFVTSDGSRLNPAIRWITNIDILNASKG
jgi:hypothetical protein